MGKPKPNKYRTRKLTKQAKVNRRSTILKSDNKFLTEVLPKKASSSKQKVQLEDKESTPAYQLPIISAVHGNGYFEKDPFSEQVIDINENPLEEHEQVIDNNENSLEAQVFPVIKVEFCEENELHDGTEKTAEKKLQQDNNQFFSLSNSNSKSQNTSHDKENIILFDVLKYLDECSKLDKFDLAGKLYAAKLRSVVFTNQQAMAENLCRQVLLEAEHFNLDEKIILTEQHPCDYLNNKKNRINVANKTQLKLNKDFEGGKSVLLKNIQGCLSENTREDRFDKFGKFYASKMRSFSDMQYFYADKLVNEIVLEAELCRLRASCKLSKTGDPPTRSFDTEKSYSKKCQLNPPNFLTSDQTCTLKKKPSRLCDQDTVKKCLDKHFTYSKLANKSPATLSTTSSKVSLKNNVTQQPKSRSSTSPKKILKKYIPQKTVKEILNKNTYNSHVKKYVTPSAPGVVSVQNSEHQLPKSVPTSSLSNIVVEKSVNKEFTTVPMKELQNSSWKLTVLPITPPTALSTQNNLQQVPKSIPSSIPVAFFNPSREPVSNLLKLMTFQQNCGNKK